MAGQKAYWNADKETRSREEREAEILGLMQRQLRYAYEHLPFYRRHYDRAGFTPDKVTWLVSTEGQKAIANYEIGGEQLFYPNAGDPNA